MLSSGGTSSGGSPSATRQSRATERLPEPSDPAGARRMRSTSCMVSACMTLKASW